jgi:Flp pilus assembly pilin Flp
LNGARPVAGLIRRLCLEESGDELLEYALLAAFVALAGAAALSALQVALRNAYTSWDAKHQALWIMPAPSGS